MHGELIENEVIFYVNRNLISSITSHKFTNHNYVLGGAVLFYGLSLLHGLH